jgi:hypothetical protein
MKKKVLFRFEEKIIVNGFEALGFYHQKVFESNLSQVKHPSQIGRENCRCVDGLEKGRKLLLHEATHPVRSGAL